MASKNSKEQKRQNTRYRIRKKVQGTSESPRLSVKKSNTAVYMQLIDDTKGHTLVAVDTRKVSGKRMQAATAIAEDLVQKAKAKNLTSICYDRSGYIYHGIVKQLFSTVQAKLNDTTN